jgi:hypothetical protein
VVENRVLDVRGRLDDEEACDIAVRNVDSEWVASAAFTAIDATDVHRFGMKLLLWGRADDGTLYAFAKAANTITTIAATTDARSGGSRWIERRSEVNIVACLCSFRGVYSGRIKGRTM